MERMMSAQAATEQLRDQAADAAETADRLVEEHRNDSLTDYTRRSLEAALDEHVEQWNRFGWPLAVLFVDVDHFKQVNDTYGHGVGDEVLTHVARTLAGQLRQGDLIGRFGGDEFVIALPAVNVDNGPFGRRPPRRWYAATRDDAPANSTTRPSRSGSPQPIDTLQPSPARRARVGQPRAVRRQASGRNQWSRHDVAAPCGVDRSAALAPGAATPAAVPKSRSSTNPTRRVDGAGRTTPSVHRRLRGTLDRACVGASNPMPFIAQAREGQ